MGAIDWIILGILGVCLFLGWRKGLMAAVINLAGIILGFFLVSHFYPLVANSLRLKFGTSPLLSHIFAVALILILMAVVIRLIIAIMDRVLKGLKLGSLNRFLGLLLGLANGLMIVICMMVVLDYFPRTSTALKDSSHHRVYAGINVLKDDLFNNLRLKEQMKYLKLLDADKQAPREKEDNK